MMTAILIIGFIYILAVLACRRANSKLKSEGLKGIGYSECYSPKKLFSVVMGFALNCLIPSHVFEQYVLRFYDKDCKPCLDKGKCTMCGCNTKAKMWSPLEEDSGDNWGPIIWNKEEYESLRSKFPVQIDVKYGKGNLDNL